MKNQVVFNCSIALSVLFTFAFYTKTTSQNLCLDNVTINTNSATLFGQSITAGSSCSSGNGYHIDPGGNINFYSSQYITLNPGFSVEQGGTFNTNIKCRTNFSEWQLVFADDFNGTSVDTLKWNVQDNVIHGTELQLYKSNACTVSGGLLNIALNSNSPINYPTGSSNWYNYNSGMVISKKFYSASPANGSYLFEIRCKIPSGNHSAIWPAFWLWPTTTQWPPEIDIFEYGGGYHNTITNTVHWVDNTQPFNDGACLVSFTGNADLTADYHIYSAIWAPDKITFFLDNVELRTVTNHVPTPMPMPLIVNFALADWWATSPDVSQIFPINFSVDYVKVYNAISYPASLLNCTANPSDCEIGSSAQISLFIEKAELNHLIVLTMFQKILIYIRILLQKKLMWTGAAL